MKPSISCLSVSRLRGKLHDKNRATPVMSWTPRNTYNIWQRTAPDSPLRRETDFRRSSLSIFQQRWKAKRLLSAYHAGMMRSEKFQRWYFPESLPSIRAGTSYTNDKMSSWIEGKERAGGRTKSERVAKQKQLEAKAPVGTMLYAKVERRLDVLVFRSCLATSVFQARKYVIDGHVKLNGQTIRNANTLLDPGDIITVDPSVIPFIQPPAEKDKLPPQLESAIDGASEEHVTGEESAAEATESQTSHSEGSTTESTEKAESSESITPPTRSKSSTNKNSPILKAHFNLPPYAQAHIFIPAYILPSFLTCSAVYVRHPTARPGYSEIPSPFDAGGDLTSLGFEWYKWRAPRMRTRVKRWWNPERTKDRKQAPRKAPEVD